MTRKVRPIQPVTQVEPLLQLDVERLSRIIDEIGKISCHFLQGFLFGGQLLSKRLRTKPTQGVAGVPMSARHAGRLGVDAS